jgi:hypothetical protein
MATLNINDLPLKEEMDSKDMAAVEGGFSFPSVLNNVAPTRLLAPLPPGKPPSNGLPAGGDTGGFGDGGDGGGGSYNDGPYGGEDPRHAD